jgi:undecaprenyl-diphosphatase
MKPLKEIFHDPRYLGFCFLFTAILLFLGDKWRSAKAFESSPRLNYRWSDALVIGIFQAIAVLPGVSRSGSTISAAKMLGWNYNQAIQYSFLLAIPAILGGLVLEGWHYAQSSELLIASISLAHYLWGFFVSFVVGYFALLFLIKLASKDKFMYFGWYCLWMGILTLGYTFIIAPNF